MKSAVAWVGIAGFLAGCALSAPPPERGNAPLLTPMPSQPEAPFELPARRPSIANGAAIYIEKCLACHGPGGQGDGEQAAQILATFGAAPANLTAESIARASTPVEWFAAISGGRIENGMPPFAASLSVDDRWDVIAYVWSLGSPDVTLATGKAVYEERCVQCHGQTGAGDGPQAEGLRLDLSDLSVYQDVAPGEWDRALESGHVPSFGGKLSSVQRSAVIDYVRSFTYDTAAVASPAPTPAPDATGAPEPASTGLTINGSVVNGTGGGPTPGNLEGAFFYFPGGLDNAPITRTLTIDADGKFTLSGFEAQAGDVVGASVQYGDVTYVSEAIPVDGSAAALDVPIWVYEQTEATDAIHIEVMHIIATQQSDAINVAEIYAVSNLGDRTVANTSGDPALRFNLPDGATAFQAMNAVPGVYSQSPEGFDYYEVIVPGNSTAQLRITYQLPLDAEVSLDRPLTYPVNSVNLLVQAGDLQPSSDQLVDQGLSEFQGRAFHVFAGSALSADQSLSFRLARAVAGPDAKLIGGIAILVAGVAVVGYGVWRARKPPEGIQVQPAAPRRPGVSPAEREKLLDAIAALDDAFDAGQIAEADYRKRREALKAKLIRAMRAE
jgi:mono/diheme cytochrome c family protein